MNHSISGFDLNINPSRYVILSGMKMKIYALIMNEILTWCIKIINVS